MVLILLSVFSPLFKRDSVVYFWVVLLTTVPALMDMLASFPPVVSQSAFAKVVGGFQQHYLPFASIGMDWVVFAVVGLLLGLMCHYLKNKRLAANAVE